MVERYRCNLIIGVLVFMHLFVSGTHAQEMVPVSLISVGNGTYSICIDKEQQRLYVFNGRDRVLELPCSTGMNPGNKEVEGDKRTPEGVYFSEKILDGKALPDFYGWRAYTLNYPNPVDVSVGKNGNGIWIHGRNIPLDSTDTKGCVSLANDDLKKLSPYLYTMHTPVIILKDMVNIDKKSMEVMEHLYGGFVLSWIAAWENKEIGHFRKFYSDRFLDTLRGDTLEAYMDRKQGLFERYDYITILTNKMTIVAADEYVVCYFLMDFSGGDFQSSGIKYVYVENSASGPKILAEEFMPLSRTTLWDKEAQDLQRMEQEELMRFLDTWTGSWKAKDFERMKECYEDSFPLLNEYFERKKRNLETYGYIEIELDDIQTDRRGVFWNLRAVQKFTSDTYRDVGIKELQLVRTNKGFYIKQEKWERIDEES
ncbi:MAG TPA: hypothetical protein ENN05_01455 [Deltaproteobacteria bacterium]|mgnify:CR=1 FL=1|nr:hypothetical protein [Deltaproteobacteria bacterium]